MNYQDLVVDNVAREIELINHRENYLLRELESLRNYRAQLIKQSHDHGTAVPAPQTLFEESPTTACRRAASSPPAL